MNKRLEGQIKRHGSYEAYKEFMRNIGKKGGNTITDKTIKRGFGSNPELAAKVSRGKNKA